MAATNADRQRKYKAALKAQRLPAVLAGKRITRLLIDHPKKLLKFEAFMLSMNREIADSLRQGSKPVAGEV